jgi:hypothetical protein
MLCSLQIQHGGASRRSSNNKTPGRQKANNMYARTPEQHPLLKKTKNGV